MCCLRTTGSKWKWPLKTHWHLVSLLKVAWTRTFTWSVVFSPFRLPLALHLLLVWQGVYLCVLIA